MDKYDELRESLSDNTKNMLSTLHDINELTIPQSAFSEGNILEKIHVFYISDIHLEEHMRKAGINLANKRTRSKYIRNLVKKIFNNDTVNYMTRRSITPCHMADLLNGYYYLFIDETRDMTDKERRDLEFKLRNNKISLSVEPRLRKCLIIDGDLADNIDNVEMFFLFMRKQINKFKYEDDICCPIFYILGNHECSNYNTVEEAVQVYKDRLSEYDITVLNNESVEFRNCIVFGGTGFAKYNNFYNSNNLVGPKDMHGNREYEACESDRTNQEYEKLLSVAKETQKPLIAVTHYPLKDWMNSQVDNHCYYFTGHDHINTISSQNNSRIFADNQIGYDNTEIELKDAIIGACYNPFINYDDGIHEITIKQYIDFYRYNGEDIRVGHIRNQLSKNAKFYMIKQNGFYGFFVVNNKNTKICEGGLVKTISEITDIRYFYECFYSMIYQYVSALLPLRKYQERLSETVKELKIPYPEAGRIHGLIVDVDFYHHMMINPNDGKITFYYSPFFGLVKELGSFSKLLKSMESHDYYIKCNRDYLEAKKQAVTKGILKKVGKDNHDFEKIDIKNSLYSVSRRVNQLQRLFTSNILREWDDSIIKRIVGEDIVNNMIPEDKELTDYKLVQKNWMNLERISSDKITPKLVRCALDNRRKCFFPYTALSDDGFVDFKSRMSNEKLQEYIKHIPEDVLKMCIKDFSDALGIRILEVFPLGLLGERELDYICNKFPVDTKFILELASRLPNERWTDEVGKRIARLVKVKARPRYCEKTVWDQITFFRNKTM